MLRWSAAQRRIRVMRGSLFHSEGDIKLLKGFKHGNDKKESLYSKELMWHVCRGWASRRHP